MQYKPPSHPTPSNHPWHPRCPSSIFCPYLTLHTTNNTLSPPCLLALGAVRMDEMLDLALASLRGHAKSAAREGLLWLLSFMPAALNEAFAPHIPRTLPGKTDTHTTTRVTPRSPFQPLSHPPNLIPPSLLVLHLSRTRTLTITLALPPSCAPLPVVLSGLSDSAESVREVALRAGQVMVSCLGSRHALLLLPSLQEGLFDEDWRIRHSSLALLGDLLFLTRYDINHITLPSYQHINT